MGKCLVTRLKGVVSDESLLKMGEMRFDVDTASSYLNISISGNGVMVSSISGENLFSDKSDGSNKTSSFTVSDSKVSKYIFAESKKEISIENKYNLNSLYINSADQKGKLGINLEDLKFCSTLTSLEILRTRGNFDISFLSGLTSLSVLNFYLSDAIGDISSLKDLTKLTGVTLGDTNVHGDISALSASKSLITVSVGSTDISGALESLNGLTLLRQLTVYGTSVTCDLDKLNNVPSLKILNMAAREVTGNPFEFLYAHDGMELFCGGDFTYSSKNWSGKSCVAIGSQSFNCTNLDLFLNDFQQITKANSTIGSSNVISMIGTRTTASDSAISTLQGKGFTVTVPEATDAASVMTMAARGGAENFGIAYKDGQLVVGPVDLSKQKIYPASGVTVETFATKEEAERFIKEKGLVPELYNTSRLF